MRRLRRALAGTCRDPDPKAGCGTAARRGFYVTPGYPPALVPACFSDGDIVYFLGGEVLNEHRGAAIHHQNQAINLCLKRIRDGPDCMSPRALLINTFLLLAYELLQGNIKGADGLMTTGIRLLRDSAPSCARRCFRRVGPRRRPSHRAS